MALDVDAALLSRWPENKMEPSLERIRALVDLLGGPQRTFPVIHITGTNGKSSTARMVESLLRAHGLRTGLYTSPHLLSTRERVCLDGEPIGEDDMLRAYEEIAPYLDVVDEQSQAAGGPRMSFFEVLTGLAFAAFADAPIDAGVIEVGLGGAWDATNVADGVVSMIMPVDLDHTELLGETAAEIAAEKSGIIKAGAQVVISVQAPDVMEVLLARCAEVGATPVVQGRDFDVISRQVAVGGQVLALRGGVTVYDDAFLPLFGPHQAGNAACALAAVEAFLGGGPLDADVVREGFAGVRVPGRLDVVRTSPTILVDAAHNPHGARALAESIEDSFTFTRLVAVVSILGEKDAEGLLDALVGVVDDVVVTRNSSPRAMDPDDLGAIAVSIFGDDRVEVVPSLPDAIARAVDLAEEAGDSSISGLGVLVTGSVATAGDAVRLLRGRI